MRDLLELIFQGCGDLLAHLHIDLRPSLAFAMGFCLLAIAALVIALVALEAGSARSWLLAASAVCGLLAVASLALGHFMADD